MESTRRNTRKSHAQTATEETGSPTPRVRPQKTPDTEAGNVRNHLAIMVVSLLVVLALVAAVQSGALPVLQYLSPIIGAIFGFYFGRATKG
jgi:hypothetical protein